MSSLIEVSTMCMLTLQLEILRYALDEMQCECEEKWSQRLTANNVCDCLYYAEMFHLYSLKMSCTEMVRSFA